MTQKHEFFSDSMINGIPWVIVSKLLLFFVYFLVSGITVRTLGSSDYGLYVLCKSTAEILILICTLGMTASYMRYLPELVFHSNKAGMKRLISKASLLQLLAFFITSVLIILNSNMLEEMFSVNFQNALLFTCGLVFFELIKNNINTILTSLYKTKVQSILSLTQGLLWLLLLILLLRNDVSVENALLAPGIAFGIVYLIAGIGLYRYVTGLNWKSPNQGIGKWRILKHSGSVAFATFMRLMMLKYTELFFLGIEHDPTTVGIYDLAYSIPLMVIVFIPAAIQDLFASGFSEAYVKDNSCLPRLVSTYFKLLIIVSMPMAIYGFFYAPMLFKLVYGDQMAQSGELAAWFCLFHAIALISVPLSMAIQATEKIANMLPTLAIQLLVNIVLGYLFIIELKLGLWGAMAAVIGTFTLTIPLRLYRVRQLIGGLYIPFMFFFKVSASCFMVGYLCSMIILPNEFLTILASIFLYCPLIVYLFFYSGLLSKADLSELNSLSNSKLRSLTKRLKNLKTSILHRFRSSVLDRRLYND